MRVVSKFFSLFKSSIVWHIIFILIILYSVSSINVLILAIGILPFLQGALLNTSVLTYFSDISFALAAFLSIYHLSTIFRGKKRRNDKAERAEDPGFREIWGRSRPLTKTFFILIAFYAVVAAYLLLWRLNAAPRVLAPNDDMLWIFFSIASFATATAISAFHLATMIFRQKRASDHMNSARRAVNNP